jgi:hypothetical protein
VVEADHDLIREARERYTKAVEADRTNRKRDQEDRKFYTGGDNQWPDGVPQERRDDGRPCETFNRLPQFVKQVTGEIRQNKPAIKVLPIDGQTDPELAKVYSAIIRHIESQSGAHRVYPKETEKAVIGGQGWWRVKADYYDDSGFDQELCIEGIPNPLAVVGDADCRHPCRYDMNYAFVTELVSRAKFKAQYPKIPDHDFDSSDMVGWIEGDFVRIAEYWVKKEVGKRKLYAFERGDTGRVENVAEDDLRQMVEAAGLEWSDDIDAMLAGLPIRLKAQREVPIFKVQSRLICGAGPLGEWQDWPGKYIPLVRVVGEEVEANDEVFRHGLIHHAKAPQVGYNYTRNASIEHYGAATKSPWLIALEQIPAAFKNMWETANKKLWPFLPYSHKPGIPLPTRIAPPSVDVAAIQESQLAAEDMKATTGIYDSHMGAKSNETSGVAIERRDAQGDTATYVYIDNMEAAIECTGRILVDLIPHYYSDERIIRMLGEDGEVEKFVEINKIMPDGKKWNDVTRGRYDVTVTTGPAYATQRQQATENMLKLMQVFPALQNVAGDVALKAMDFPLSDKLSERLRAVLPPGIDEEIDREKAEKNGGQPPEAKPSPEEQKMMADVQLKQADQQARQEEAAMKLQLSQAEAQAKMELAREEAGARLQLEREKAQLEAQNEAARAERENALAIEKMNREFQLAERKMQMEERLAQHSASMREKEVSLKANRPGGDLDK